MDQRIDRAGSFFDLFKEFVHLRLLGDIATGKKNRFISIRKLGNPLGAARADVESMPVAGQARVNAAPIPELAPVTMTAFADNRAPHPD